MSSNKIRLLRKAIKLKFKSTIPCVGKVQDKIRIWIPCANVLNKRALQVNKRYHLGLKISNCILSSGVHYENRGDQPFYYLFNEEDIEALTGYIIIYQGEM